MLCKQKILRKYEFKQILRHSFNNEKKIIHSPIIIFVLLKSYLPKIGIIISKKAVKLACKRNKIKRIIKEYIQHNQLYNWSCIFILQKMNNILDKDIKDCLKEYILKIKNEYE